MINEKILEYCEAQNFEVDIYKKSALITLNFFEINIDLSEDALNIDFQSLLKYDSTINLIVNYLESLARTVKYIKLGTRSLFRAVGVKLTAQDFVNLILFLLEVTSKFGDYSWKDYVKDLGFVKVDGHILAMTSLRSVEDEALIPLSDYGKVRPIASYREFYMYVDLSIEDKIEEKAILFRSVFDA